MPPYVLALAMEDSSKAKTPDSETPPQSQPVITKSISFSGNGTLKRHHPAAAQPVVVFYKECLKNHAAGIGGLALDGCGEFMPSPAATNADPTSLKCAACGCHRNFHRRELDEPSSASPAAATAHFISFHHPQRLPPPLNLSLTPSPSTSPGQSPPPPAAATYASAPHMLLALSNGFSAPSDETHHQNHHQQAPNPAKSENPVGRKRFRTKFSQTQKIKMQSFAEKLGWKLHKSDDRVVEEFCSEIGVGRGVLKVWMHNNKHNLGKRDQHSTVINTNNNNNNNTNGTNNNHDDDDEGEEDGNVNGSGGNSRASFDTDAYNNNSNNTTDNENHHSEGNSAPPLPHPPHLHLHHLSTNLSSSSS